MYHQTRVHKSVYTCGSKPLSETVDFA